MQVLHSKVYKFVFLLVLIGTALSANALVFDAKILIDRVLNSPTLTIRYSGASVALVEMRVNGSSVGTRSVDSSITEGETNFTLDVASLQDGENEVEIRLFNDAGKLIGTETTKIFAEDGVEAPVSLSSPAGGTTVRGPVPIKVGIIKELKNVFVSFFVDNQFKSMLNFPPYEYVWDTTRESNGWHDVEAWIVDERSNTYKTRKVRVFVNNPSGRTERHSANTAPAAMPKVGSPDLEASGNPVHIEVVGSNVGLRVGTPATSAGSNKVTNLSTPSIPALISNNPIHVELTKVEAGLKPIRVSQTTGTGPKLMTPTGTRTVTIKKPEPPKAKVAPKPEPVKVEKPKVEPKPVVVAKVEPPKPPVAKPEPPKAQPKPVTVVKPKPVAVVQPKPAVKVEAPKQAEPKQSGLPTAKEWKIYTKEDPITVASAKKPATPPANVITTPAVNNNLVQITQGTRLPEVGSFAVLMDDVYVNFDISPRTLDGVPMAPFRHLIEKAGGNITWVASERAVQAKTASQEIFIRIGDKNGKINKVPVTLEVAPALEEGRTIVPLSFVREALKVNIEYDKATGHVLITSAE